MGIIRDTRLLDKTTFDNPTEFLQAGSSVEADMLFDLSKDYLVQMIQDLDEKLFELEQDTSSLTELNRVKLYLRNNLDSLSGEKNPYQLGVFMAFTNIHNYLHKKLYKKDLG